ncbi:MAG TPA: hypothetical protein VN249_02725, partial [Prolixibacteraceae bacterium]|nr:hypothetical protein [Prolixibacteraceae bacterium]
MRQMKYPGLVRIIITILFIHLLIFNALPGKSESWRTITEPTSAKVKVASLSYIPVKWNKEANLK